MSIPFDPEQSKVITHETGPALVLAGPGSGKTFTLTHHIKFLIERGLFKPGEILVLTFTKKAAVSMEERFHEICNFKSVFFGTFHSCFYRLYIEFVRYQKIISPQEKAEILDKITPNDFTREDLNNYISRRKSKIYVSDSFQSDSKLDEAFKIYNEILTDRGLLDYDDILLNFLNALNKNPQMVNIIKNRFKALLIDEFQDINHVQFEIIKLLSSKHTHVFVVGDEDQSIYRFRGADPDIMKEFEEHFHPEIYYLNKNYRSKPGIINASKVLINKNQNRIKESEIIKLMRSDLSDFQVRILRSSDEIASDIRSEIRQNKNKQSAVLLRTNKDVRGYESVLLAGNSEIYTHIVDAIEAYLDFTITKKRASLFKILDCPERTGLLRSFFKDDPVDLSKLVRASLGRRYAGDLNIFKMQIDNINKMLPETAIFYLRKIMKLEEYFIKTHSTEKTMEIKTSFDKISSLAGEYKTLNELRDQLKMILKEREYKVSKNNIRIMTYHAAKGLEFDYVFLPDIVEGKVPSLASLSEDALEEERRLFYVAMTRAKEKLFIYTIKNEESITKMPSRFLDDLII